MSRELKWLDSIISHQLWVQMLRCGTSFGSPLAFFFLLGLFVVFFFGYGFADEVAGWMRQWSGLWAVALSKTELILLRPFLARCL